MTPAEIEKIKDLLPTALGSEEIRSRIAADIRRRSVFSARMASAPYLAKVREVCALVSDGSISKADARNRLEAVLERLGHSMQDGGGISNPISILRLNLIIDTQRQMAASVSRILAQTSATRFHLPAWRLERISPRRVPRIDWSARWYAAGQSVAWRGASRQQFVALKDSPVWQALGDGTGGFRDTLFNPYPPFAFGSGMGWTDVDRDEAMRLGLDLGGTRSVASASLSPGERAVRDAIDRYGFENIMEGLQ